MTIRDHIEAVVAIILGASLVVFGINGATDTGYEKGYAAAKAEYEVLPIIKADQTPYKVRPDKYVEHACPPAIIVQASPVIEVDKTE